MEPQHIGNLMQDKKWELQTQESTRLPTGEEKKLELSLKSKLIKDSTLPEVKDVLRYVMVKIGLRANNWPNDIETLVLYEHIVENYGGNNLDEIKLAFNMAIAGKLNLEEIEHYENFSCIYFSKIMNAYRLWSSEAFRQIEQKVVEVPEQRIFTEEEINDGLREDVERQYSRFLKGYELKGLEFNKVILQIDGLIKEGDSVLGYFKKCLEQGKPHIYVRG